MEVDRNLFFRELTMKICGSLHIEAAMAETLAYLRRFMPADEMYLCLFDYERGIYRLVAKAGSGGGVLTDRAFRLSPEAASAVGAFDTTRVKRVRRIADDPLISSLFTPQEFNRRSCLVLPLVIDGRLIGVAQIYTAGEGKYSEEDAELISCAARPFSIALANALEHMELMRLKQRTDEENRTLRQKMVSAPQTELIGKDGGLRGVYDMLSMVAPTDSPVLILGETGTGKEVAANAVYRASSRANGPFVKVNCGALPASLIDTELFGHEKGSFTGAAERRIGRFERADKGTIFLDEVGELPLDAQVRLLRVLQEHEIERVGGTSPVRVDIRLICATHRDLPAMVADGTFREDLYFRINVFPIMIPPLRQRKEDIPALVRHFVGAKAREMGLGNIPPTDAAEMELLKNYEWPGNVRELQNIIERALILSKNGKLSFAPLMPAQTKGESAAAETYNDAAKDAIIGALEACGGRVSGENGAAARLGLNASTLRNKMIKLGINAHAYKKGPGKR